VATAQGARPLKGVSAFQGNTVKRTYVYVDGFNLYYGCLKNTSFKWLNIRRMCELLLAKNDIRKIYYFTAKISGTTDDPDKPQRQLKYIRALKTLPDFEIVDGHFIVERVTLQRADGTGPVDVIRKKEKRSDVNLVSLLLWDAHCNNFETAVIVSGDSDFHTPVTMVKHYFRKEIGILDPQRNGTPLSPMNREATFYKPIREGILRVSQFPDAITDAKGTFHKPGEWY
jgi:hypothetical protein